MSYTKQELKYLMAFYHIDKMPLYHEKDFVGYVTKELKYEKSRWTYLRSDDYAIDLACKQIDNIIRIVKKWNEKIKVVCESHYEHDVWEYADKDGVVRHHVYPHKEDTIRTYELEGTFDEVCEKMYRENNRLRYCNGSYHKFQDEQMEEDYYLWRCLISEGRSFNLYYGNGVVD